MNNYVLYLLPHYAPVVNVKAKSILDANKKVCQKFPLTVIGTAATASHLVSDGTTYTLELHEEVPAFNETIGG